MKTEENADVKASEVGSKKIKYAFHISPECMKAINDMYKKDGSSTRNEFISFLFALPVMLTFQLIAERINEIPSSIHS